MSLRRAAAAGVLWTGAATATAIVLRIVTLAVIARYLTQAELGLVSMLLAIILTLQAFGDFGLGAVIIQRPTMDAAQLSSLYWLAQLAGVLGFALVLLLEPVIVGMYAEPRLDGLVGWLALRFLLTPIGIPFVSQLMRDLAFRKVFAIQTIAAAAGSVFTIAGAIGGLGVHALIGGELIATAVTAALALVLGWRVWHPQLRFRRADLREPLRFGLFQIGERAFNMIATNIDYVLVGRVLGAKALGVYALAFELTSTPARLNAVLTRVAFPVLARKQADSDGFRRGLLELVRLIALVQLPGLAALAVLAPVFVPVLLGPGWADVVPLVQVLAVFGAIRVLGNPSGPAFLAKGRPELGFLFNLGVVVVVAPTMWFVVDQGLAAVAWAWVAIIAVQLVALAAILNEITGTRWRSWGSALARPLVVTALSVGWLMIAGELAARLTHSQGGQLALALCGGAVVLLPAAWWIERGFVRSVISALRRPLATS